MTELTSIQVDKKLKADLNSLKVHPRQPYHEVIRELIKEKKELKKHTRTV